MFNEIKSLLKHSSVYGAANLLSKGIGFLMIPVYTHYLSPSDYGTLELLDLTINITTMFIGMGLGSAIIRFYHKYENPEEKNEVFTTALIFVSLSCILVVVLLEFLSFYFAKLILGNSGLFRYFQIVFVAMGLQTISTVPESLLLASKQSVKFSSISIATLISYLTFNILFLVVLKMGIVGILLSMVITKIFNTSSLLIITLKKIDLRFDLNKLKEMISFGMPLIPASLSMFVIHFSDRFFIKQFCTLNEVGLYSLGYKFGMILSFLISAPIFRVWDSQRFEIAKSDDAKQVFGRIFTYFSAVLIFSGLGISVFIDEVIYIMASSEYHGAAHIVPIIVLSYILFGISNFFTLGIMLTNNTKYIAYTQISAAIINILLNFILISRYGIIGAAISTLSSFLFLAVFNFIISQRLYHITCEYRRVLILFVIAGLTFGLSQLIKAPLMISFGIKSILLVCFPLILVLGKFFYEEEIIKSKELLKSIASRFGIAKA